CEVPADGSRLHALRSSETLPGRQSAASFTKSEDDIALVGQRVLIPYRDAPVELALKFFMGPLPGVAPSTTSSTSTRITGGHSASASGPISMSAHLRADRRLSGVHSTAEGRGAGRGARCPRVREDLGRVSGTRVGARLRACHRLA